jgi:hypothetical protein
MAAPTISKENSVSQLTRCHELPAGCTHFPEFDRPGSESLGLASGFIQYLGEASDDQLSDFSLHHLGEASECALALKRKLADLADAIIEQREAERAAATQTARDGHYHRQKALKGEMATLLWDLAEARLQHLLLERLAELVRQLPLERRPALRVVRAVPTEPADNGTVSIQPAQMDEDRLKELVQGFVRELLPGPDHLTVGGWFRDRATSNEMRRRQSADERALAVRYFDAWGCALCEQKGAQYGADGLCHRCYCRTRARVAAIWKAMRADRAAMSGSVTAQAVAD